MTDVNRFSLACEWMAGRGGQRLELTNEDKLCLYGLYKQATIGDAEIVSRPSMVDFAGRAKW